MSVPVGRRGQQKLGVITKAIDLADYTITICKNEANFPKRERWILTQKIVNLALDTLTDVRKANSVHVVLAEDLVYRRQLQVDAFANLEALLSLIDVAYRNLGLETRRVEYWTGLIVDLENFISKWRKSDRERYGSLLKEER